MTDIRRPRCFRLAAHGAVMGAVVGLTFMLPLPQIEALDILFVVAAALAAGLVSGALAALQLLMLLRTNRSAAGRALAWSAAALLGGLVFCGLALAMLGNIVLSAFLASIWALGWPLFFRER